MSASTVAARRALQQQQARYLYRRALKSVLNWAVHREIFYVEAQKTREAFEANKDLQNLETIDRLLYEGDMRLKKLAHPEPYIAPCAPGGSKDNRNLPVPKEFEIVLDFGRQENH